MQETDVFVSLCYDDAFKPLSRSIWDHIGCVVTRPGKISAVTSTPSAPLCAFHFAVNLDTP